MPYYKIKMLAKGNVKGTENDYLEAFRDRPYLLNPVVILDNDNLKIELEVEANSSDSAEKFAIEQVWELGHATLKDINGFCVQKLGVEEMPSIK